MPIQTLFLIPFPPLSKLAAHKQQLLAGMSPHVSIQRTQSRKLLLLVARHLIQQCALHVDDFIVRERKNEVLAPSVDQTERQSVVIASAEEWIRLKVLQGVVHPAHVPLEVKTKSPAVNRMTYLRPSCRLLGNHHPARADSMEHLI